ncbi:MAG: branched-chain amino acid ABC transporter permease [Betaproteobacteria bacterium]|nr:MAG: branched-chain amino acid ABC transporter permease [Betaproteobacteria bacterium]
MSTRLQFALGAGLLIALAAIPPVASLAGIPFLLTLFTRIVIVAIASVSLNLILGYGGMYSLGHAVYIGIGGYTVGILAFHGVHSGLVQWPLALAVSALFALVTGALCLRTRGVYFIMITLAFAQMVYFLTVGVAKYGGDDGLTIARRSSFGGLVNLADRTTFYYVSLAFLLAAVLVVWRISRSHFGMVVRGACANDRRMQALGFPTYRYRLAAYVIAGTMGGLAGALLANQTDFVNPEMLSWTRSGDLMIMVILGGSGSVIGPVAGTVAYMVLEEVLSGITEHWQIILGPLVVLMALVRQGGIVGWLSPKRHA